MSADRILVEGVADGRAMVLDEPISFWGGLDPTTGVIVDRRHPQAGASIVGRVLVMPAGRGSSSSSAVLAEALRLGCGPAAIVLRTVDHIVALGALVADNLYDRSCPVIVSYADITDGARVAIVDGEVLT